ncbi:membrane protein [Streptomyces noursei ATCC 11455]|uniref:tetratricopeptide repeat protein n=1 Tax=Streptomyces noursei TaxID=1971 RepID=UPI00081C59D5|nr:membrane protein [Streptomyces noursei ATCC 11455]
MGGKITYIFLATVLVLVFGVVAMEGVLLLMTGEPAAMGMGAVAFVLPCLGGWFLWANTRFARDANRLARELEAEGGLPLDDIARTPGGRIDRDAADAVFARRRAETEEAPGDWRTWFRLAVAYRDARDTPRARKAMQRAIALHDGRPVPGDPEPARTA